MQSRKNKYKQELEINQKKDAVYEPSYTIFLLQFHHLKVCLMKPFAVVLDDVDWLLSLNNFFFTGVSS